MLKYHRVIMKSHNKFQKNNHFSMDWRPNKHKASLLEVIKNNTHNKLILRWKYFFINLIVILNSNFNNP